MQMDTKGSGEFTANYEVGCNKCKIKFHFETIFVLKNGQPKFIKNGYDKCIKAWNGEAGMLNKKNANKH